MDQVQYYAVCQVNGPISIRLEGDSANAARKTFQKVDEQAAIDEQRSDIEDDLDVDDAAQLNETQMTARLEAAGASWIEPLGDTGPNGHAKADDWWLWTVDQKA